MAEPATQPRTPSTQTNRLIELCEAVLAGEKGKLNELNLYLQERIMALDQARASFLEGVAERLNRSAAAGEFEKLVLMAPPRALGVLRHALKPAVARRIEVTDDHERIKASAEDVRLILRDLRIPER